LNANALALMEKASATLEQARLLLGARHYDGAADRAYYAMFYAASALLAQRGLQFRSHQGVHSAFGKEFAKAGAVDVKYHRMLLNAFELRQIADYGPQAKTIAATAKRVCDSAADFVSMAQALMEEGPERKK
jgi:uncharacterized protein (UPF0332 family)